MSPVVVRIALLAAGLTALALLVTPRSEINAGLGYDGLQYAEMVRHFRGEPTAAVSSLAAYRVVAPAVVAWSGLGIRDGFLALDVAASFASLVLLAALLIRLGVRERLTALALVWWALLPAGIRLFIYLPVLTDGPAMALMLALIVAAEHRRTVLFALLLPVAVLTRESLLALAPLVLMVDRSSTGLLRSSARMVAATAPAVAALVAVRAFPPMPVDPVISLPMSAAIHALVLLLNVDGDAWRYLAALPIGLGALLVGPVLALRDPGSTRRRAPQWIYLATIALAGAAVGGGDHDRYLLPLSIPLIVALFATPTGFGWRTWAALTALHALAVRPLGPLGTDEAAARAYLPAGMDLHDLAVTAAISSVAVAAALAIGLWSLRTQPVELDRSAPVLLGRGR